MFMLMADHNFTALDLARAKRRDLFAQVLSARPRVELELLAERTPLLIDLELTGCETAQEYLDIIVQMLRHKN